jgi:hypothetical protein
VPGITATNNLPYPLSTDRLADQGRYTRDLAVALDSRFLSHDTDIARSNTPPLAVVVRTTQKDFLQNDGTGFTELFDFETVAEDNDGMVSLETDPRVININRIGYWNIGVYLEMGGSLCNPGFVSLIISDTGDYVAEMHDAQVSLVAGHSETIIRVPNSSDFPLRITSRVSFSGSNCSNVCTARNIRMWAYWVRDL